MRPGVRVLATNAAATWAAKAVVSLVLFGWQLFLARRLGPEGFGVYGTIGALLALAAPVADAGLGLVVSRDVAARPVTAAPVLAATLAVQPVLALAAGLVVAALLALGVPVTVAPGLAALAASALVTDAVGNLFHNQLVAAERLKAAAAVSVVHALSLGAIGVALVTGGLGLVGAYSATLAASSVRAVVYWRTLALRPAWPANVHLAARLLGAGWPIGLLALLGLARLHTDRLLAAALLGVEAAGQLQAALVVAFGITEFVGATLLLVGLPSMARLWADGHAAAFWALGNRLAAVGVALALPVAVGFTLAGDTLTVLAFGPAYAATADVLRLFLWAAVLAMLTGVLSQALLCQHRQRALLLARVLIVALHVALLAVLLPRLGVLGAGWASLATEAAALVALLLLVAPRRWRAGRQP